MKKKKKQYPYEIPGSGKGWLGKVFFMSSFPKSCKLPSFILGEDVFQINSQLTNFNTIVFNCNLN